LQRVLLGARIMDQFEAGENREHASFSIFEVAQLALAGPAGRSGKNLSRSEKSVI